MSYDPAKRKLNLRKHGINLAEDDRETYGEQRLISLGWLKSRVVVLVWTDREDEPHLISCREAETHEQEAYFHAFPKA